MHFFLLLITGAYIPKEIQNVISGLNDILFPYGLISSNKNKNANSFISTDSLLKLVYWFISVFNKNADFGISIWFNYAIIKGS